MNGEDEEAVGCRLYVNNQFHDGGWRLLAAGLRGTSKHTSYC